MPGYAFAHDGKAYAPDGAEAISDVDAHNKQVEQDKLAYLATKPDRISAYVGGLIEENFNKERQLTTWLGTPIGTCHSSSSWQVGSYKGSRMYQIYATVNGVRYTGRSFGAGMLVNLRKCAKQ